MSIGKCFSGVVLVSTWLVSLGGFAREARAAPSVGYAYATGYYKKETRPTLYQPLNVLDGREQTAWCTTTSDSLAEVLTIGFKGLARIDEIRVYTGNGLDDPTFREFSRAKEISFSGTSGAQAITVSDNRGLQVVHLKQVLVESRLVVEVLEQYPAEDPAMPVCLSDIIFYSEGKPLNGSWMTTQLKYDRSQVSFLGTWYGGQDGAPDRFLSFFVDGTYRFDYEPFLQADKARSFGGAWEALGGQLLIEIPEKGKVNARAARAKKEVGAAVVRELLLSGELPPELRGAYRDRR